jgi:hypothetical protein
VARTVRLLGSIPASVTLAALLAGCGPRPDPRLANLAEGISQDSVLRVMGADSANRTDSFLVNGQSISTLYFARTGALDSAALADRNMSPVVLISGTVVGWGWEKWDSIAGANAIEVAPPTGD